MNDSGIHELRESTPRLHQHPYNAAKSKFHERKSQINFTASPIVPIHSSTLNESLLTSVESWSIYNCTPNFYVERPASAASSTSASLPYSSHSPSPDEFYKNHQECMQRTPMKNVVSSTKLGSPERNEIISGRKPTSMTKWITPKTERCSPAKKRLFGLNHINGNGIAKSKTSLASYTYTKHDPVVYFMKKRNVGQVVETVFSHLRDSDLYNCKRVSRNWMEAVERFPTIRKAVNEYEHKIEVNKENPNKLKVLFGKQPQPKSVADATYASDKFIQVAQTLNENQSLQKCPSCQQPQIVEYSIGQCTNFNCGYICCIKCNSYSRDGPEHFVDTCNGSALDIKKPKRRTLLDSPPHSQLSFLSSSQSMDNSHLYASKDSCYGTYDESEFGSLSNNSSSLTNIVNNLDNSTSNNHNDSNNTHKGRKSLGDSNREQTNLRKQTHRNSLYIPVMQIKNGCHKSPEKLGSVKIGGEQYKGAGTKASKKRLRRLLK